jgi:hypothetical protein
MSEVSDAFLKPGAVEQVFNRIFGFLDAPGT